MVSLCKYDSATVNLVNQVTIVTERLQLPTTDTNAAVLRQFNADKGEGVGLVGWFLDEAKIYRLIAN